MTTELEGPPDLLTVNYEIQRLQRYHDRLLILETEDQEAINAFLEGFLIHFRNLLDFLDSRGGDDDIKAIDFVPDFKSTNSPEKYRERINKRLAHLSRSRADHKKGWDVPTMLNEMRDSFDEFWQAAVTQVGEEE